MGRASPTNIGFIGFIVTLHRFGLLKLQNIGTSHGFGTLECERTVSESTISRIWDRVGEHNLAGMTSRTVLNSVPD